MAPAGPRDPAPARRRNAAAAGAVLILGALFGFHHLADPDVFQQAAVGRAILADPASYGRSTFHHAWPDHPYVEDKGLASVIAALFDAAGGTDGLMLLQVLMTTLVAAGVFLAVRSGGASPAAGVAATALVLAACAFRLEPRPDTLSLAMLAGMIAMLTAVPYRHLIWTVPAAMALWVNLHGYFPLGLLVLAAALAAAAAGDRTLRGLCGGASRAVAVRRGGLLLGLGAVACLAHPQGWRAAVWPAVQLRVLGSEPVLREAIQEFGPSGDLLTGMGAAGWIALAAVPLTAVVLELTPWRRSFAARAAAASLLAAPWLVAPTAGLRTWPYRILLVLVIFAVFEAPPALRDRRLFPPLLLAGMVVLSVPLIRNLTLLPLAAVFLAAPAWSRAVSGGALSRAGRVAAHVAVVLLVAGVCWMRLADRIPAGSVRAPGWTGWGADERILPAGAAGFVARENPPGEILNTFDNGGYLLYRLHPDRKVFISGNTSMYPAGFLAFYREGVMGGNAALGTLRKRYGIRTVVLEHAAMDTPALVSRLSHSPDWALVFADDAAAVFVHREDATRELIERHTVDLDGAGLHDTSGTSPPRVLSWLGARRRLFPALNRGIFLRAVGRADLALVQAERLWENAPAEPVATFLAASAEEAGRLGGVVGRLEQARRLFPRSETVASWLSRALFVRALSRLDAGEAGPARGDLRRSLELTPEEAGPALALARLAAREGNETEARSLLERALRSGPERKVRERAAADPLLAPLLPRGGGDAGLPAPAPRGESLDDPK